MSKFGKSTFVVIVLKNFLNLNSKAQLRIYIKTDFNYKTRYQIYALICDWRTGEYIEQTGG